MANQYDASVLTTAAAAISAGLVAQALFGVLRGRDEGRIAGHRMA